VASLLALLALVTLLIKQVVEWQHAREMQTLSNLSPEPTVNLKAAS
jgi:sulfate transport system permease protein